MEHSYVEFMIMAYWVICRNEIYENNWSRMNKKKTKKEMFKSNNNKKQG